MRRMRLADIKVTQRVRQDLGDIETLAKSIFEVGLLHPVVVSKSGELMAGLRTLRAVEMLGWEDVAVTVSSLDNPARGEMIENTVRKDLTLSEKAALAERLEPLIKKEASLRKAHSHKASAKFAGGEARREVAKLVGLSHTTLSKVKEVNNAAEEDPKRWGALKAKMDKSGLVDGAYKRLKAHRQFDEISKCQIPLPVGPFSCLVIDPPWPYESRLEDLTHRCTIPYPSMSMENLMELEVASRAADDAVCWLWTTNQFMEEAHHLMRQWGFEKKTILTWFKPGPGVGDWLRNNTEHCLFGVKGSPVWLNETVTTSLNAPRTKHSKKPEEFFTLVEKLCPGNKVELFSRKTRPGWVAWGDEVPAEESVAENPSPRSEPSVNVCQNVTLGA